MQWIILGDYGSGKTLFLVLQAVGSDRDVWGNFKLRLDNYSRIEPMEISKVGSNKLLVLDEMQTWLESRSSMTFLNKFITNIIDQADKRDVDVFGTAHIFSSIDIRFRDNVHRIVRCERIGSKGMDFARVEDTRDFRYHILNTYSGQIKKKILRYEKAIKYFELFNTREIIQYPNQKDTELDLLLRQDPAEAYTRLMSIAREIKGNNGAKYTHSKVELTLMKNGYSPKHGRLVYSCLKEIEEKPIPPVKKKKVLSKKKVKLGQGKKKVVKIKLK